MEELDDLFWRAQLGNDEAYTEIVERFQAMAYGFAYAFLSDYKLAEDAVQEAFIEAYCSLGDLHQPRAFPAWFKRILFKHCDRMTRGKKPVIEPLESRIELPSPSPDLLDIVERLEESTRVQAAIRNLPQNQRVVITLYYMNGYTQQEIAEFLEYLGERYALGRSA